MLCRCPSCGHELSRPILTGIKSCPRCCSFFEANHTNRLLGASWELHKNNNMGLEQFKFNAKLSDAEAEFVYRYIVDECYSHDEFLKLLRTKEKD